MIKTVGSAALLLLIISGCTATLSVGGYTEIHERNQLTYSELQDHLCDKSVCVILNDNQKISGTIGGISRDSVRLRSDVSKESVAVATRDVCCIEKTNHVGGGILGFFGGTLGGFLFGLLVGEVVMPRGGDMRGLGVFLIAMGGGGLGLVGGTLFGSIHGLVDRYEFEGDSLHVTMK